MIGLPEAAEAAELEAAELEAAEHEAAVQEAEMVEVATLRTSEPGIGALDSDKPAAPTQESVATAPAGASVDADTRATGTRSVQDTAQPRSGAAERREAPRKAAPIVFLCLLAAGGLAAAGFAGNASDRAAFGVLRGKGEAPREPEPPTGAAGFESLRPAYARSVAELVSARASVSELSAAFAPDRLVGLSAEEAGKAARALVEAAKAGGMDPERALGAVLPKGGAVSALLATDRDRRDFLAAAARDAPATLRHAEAYAEIARLVPLMRSIRGLYGALLESAYDALATRKSASPGPEATGPVARRGEVYAPPKRGLDRAHPYALDVFFTRIERSPSGEIGPEILSVSSGIVLAAADDWKGGGGPSAYRSGGLSPNSGNGVIVYDPAARRYYSYFHLSRVNVGPGELVEKGKVLGRGGDTGANARKAGHGGHVHVEIFDASKDRALPALEIREIIF